MVAAVDSGRLTRLRIQRSVARILEAKERAGLDRKSSVNLEGISDAVNSPEANDKAQEVADRAVTLVRNAPGLVPVVRDATMRPSRSCGQSRARSESSCGVSGPPGMAGR